MRTNSVLTPCKARCGTFTLLLPLLSHTPTSNVRYISFQRNLQLKIHLSSYQFRVTTQVVCCPKKPVWLGAKYAWNDAVCARRRGNLRIAQGRAKRRPGYCRMSPTFALQGQKRKNQRLLFVHTLHLLYIPGRRFALPWAMRRLPLRVGCSK